MARISCGPGRFRRGMRLKLARQTDPNLRVTIELAMTDSCAHTGGSVAASDLW
jgi:hypothetical protein